MYKTHMHPTKKGAFLFDVHCDNCTSQLQDKETGHTLFNSTKDADIAMIYAEWVRTLNGVYCSKACQEAANKT